jgi:hypothetical protein
MQYEYWSTLALGLIAGLLLTLAVGINLAKGQAVWVYVVGLFAAVVALAAGFHATHTIINDLIGAILGIHWIVDLALGLGLIAFLVLLFFRGVLPPQVFPGVATVALVAVAFVAPSVQVDHGTVPGDFGNGISITLKEAAWPGLNLTQTWFGKPGRPADYYVGATRVWRNR